MSILINVGKILFAVFQRRLSRVCKVSGFGQLGKGREMPHAYSVAAFIIWHMLWEKQYINIRKATMKTQFKVFPEPQKRSDQEEGRKKKRSVGIERTVQKETLQGLSDGGFSFAFDVSISRATEKGRRFDSSAQRLIMIFRG
jgi:hypothetical protein